MRNELSGKILIPSFSLLKVKKKKNHPNLSIGLEEGKAIAEHMHKDGRFE